MFSKLVLKSTVQLPLIANRTSYASRVRGVRIKNIETSKVTPISIGQWSTLAAGGLGLASLCSYALYTGHSTTMSAMDKISLGVWPEYVKSRIHSTYLYFGSGIAVTAATASALFRNERFMRFMSMRSPMQLILGSFALSIASGIATRSLPYPQGGIGPKHLAWLLHAVTIGGLIAPICFVGPAILTRAAIYTGGIVGGFSALAMCAPSDKFVNLGGPLAMGLGVVFASSLASVFVSPVGTLGLSLYSISVYGGLIVFSGFLLYDTQRVLKKAEMLPYGAVYDPINASLGIYINTINIFIRMVSVLQGNRRK